MNVNEYLSNFNKGNKKPSLDVMHFFMTKYNYFEREMKFIHIAGTNGKGSTTEMINNILLKQGYTVGKFISPHLIKYNERININNVPITDNDLSDLISELQPLIHEYESSYNLKVSYFELITMIALLYFYRNKVNFVVLETGLGGLYDCTNIISNPLISIITSVGYDHVQILGNTLSDIAKQKAGIIKPNSHTIFYKQSNEINSIFLDACNMMNNKLHLVSKSNISNYSYNKDFQYFNYNEYSNICINLKGNCQINNAIISIEAISILKKLGYIIDEDNLKAGLSSVIHKGRMETLSSSPLIVFDGAHNEDSILNFNNTINDLYSELHKTYIISILKRKDYKKILELLVKDDGSTYILTTGNDINKFTSNLKLLDICTSFNMKKSHFKTMDFNDALNCSYNSLKVNSITFIVGSFYVYNSASAFLN